MKNNEIELRRLVCTCCGEETNEDNSYAFGGELLCDTCYFEETVECEHCGNRIWNDDNSGSDSVPLCGSCYDNYYTTCEDCGRIIHRDYANYIDDYDDIPYCDTRYMITATSPSPYFTATVTAISV